MKKIVSGKELQEKMSESIQLLCGTVGQTLGPIGNNVLIDHSTFCPFITNDGVTIAKNIESDDAVIGAILEIIKEASIKTNDVAGDGTTTTLVLLESLYVQSLEYIKKGVSPILLKKRLDKTLEIILKELNSLKRKATITDLKHIAQASASDEQLGTLAYQVMRKVKQKEAITIKEVSSDKTYVSFQKGYTCKVSPASFYFFKDSSKLNYQDAYVLLMNTFLTNMESISFLVNDLLKNKRDLVIIASGFDDLLVEEIVSLSLTQDLHICLLKIEEYGMHVYEILKDLQCITHANIIEQDSYITSKDIGVAQTIEIANDQIRIDFKINDCTKRYVAALKKEVKEKINDLEKEFYEKRIAMFSNGTAQILLGAPTKTEGLEKRMRLEDALCALSVSNEGILPGGGLSFLKVASRLKNTSDASDIWLNALERPFEQILKNAGLDFLELRKIVEKNGENIVYNIIDNTWEDSNKTKVIDPFLVVKQALINATSIAGMLLTTTSLIINEYTNNSCKENEYSHWE